MSKYYSCDNHTSFDNDCVDCKSLYRPNPPLNSEEIKDEISAFLANNFNLDYSVEKELCNLIESYGRRKYEQGVIAGTNLYREYDGKPQQEGQ